MGFALAVVPAWAGGAFAQGAEPRYVPGEVLVKFRRGVAARDRQSLATEMQALESRTLGRLAIERVRIAGGVEEAVARFSRDPRVEYVEPNFYVHASILPNDSLLSRLWGLRNSGQTGGTPDADVSAENAWDVTTGSASVLVGVIDTGVDYNHPDLAANIFTNPGEIAGNGVDDEGNGFVDDVHGWNFLAGTNDPLDDHGHGTHVAGTIGALGNNRIGIAGVAWNVRLLPIKFLTSQGYGTIADAVLCVDYATLMGCQLTNNSWGGGDSSQALVDAIRASGESGALFVAAAGNAALDLDLVPSYPATYGLPCIVSVAATDDHDELAPFSNYGAAHVDLAAPGVGITSTVLRSRYGSLSGTSMATPHVTGALALVFSRFPALAAADAKALLLARVDPVPWLRGRVLTGGRLNAFLPIAEPDHVAPGSITDLGTEEITGNTVTLTWTSTGDDGAQGRTSRYDVRWSTAPIDAANFEGATRVAGPGIPGLPGSRERLKIAALSFGTRYWFALRALDEFANAGPISNLASAVTVGAPVLSLSTTHVASRLLSGQSETRKLRLTNSGPSPMEFRFRSRPEVHSAAAERTRTAAARGIASRIEPEAARASYDGGRAPLRAAHARPAPPGPRVTAGAGVRVLILHGLGDVSEIAQLLRAHDDIAWVDTYDAARDPAPPALLEPYDVVVVSVSFPFGGLSRVGDLIADFADQGGGVVVTLASFINGYQPRGRFMDEGYMPLELGTGPNAPSSLGAFDAAHPIMAGVAQVEGELLGHNALAPGAHAVAHWQNGDPLVATRGHNIVAVNVFVGSPGYWVGDVPALIHNAVMWTSSGVDWLTVSPHTGSVPGGGSLDVDLRFEAGALGTGDYGADLVLSTNDPSRRESIVSAQLAASGAPDLAVRGDRIELDSDIAYGAAGAATEHRLASPAAPQGDATLEVQAEGAFVDAAQSATVEVEGTRLGTLSGSGTDCRVVRRTFRVDPPALAAWLADGRVEVRVANSPAVGAACPRNHHSVRLVYRGPDDRLDWGLVPAGEARELALEVANQGATTLEIGSVTTDHPDFTVSAPRLTLPPGQSERLRVRFAPSSAGARAARLLVSSNDPDEPRVSLPLAGAGAPPPAIAARIDLHVDPLDPKRLDRWLTASLELPAPYRNRDVVRRSVRLNGVVPAARDRDHGNRHRGYERDRNGALVLRFDRDEAIASLPEADSADLVITGTLDSGERFEGAERVRVIRPRLLHPNGGERFPSRQYVTLRWEAPAGWNVRRAALAYSIGGREWKTITEHAHGRSHAWKVPRVTSDSVRVRVALYDRDGLLGMDSSDQPFRIERAPTDAEESAEDLPSVFALLPAAPNPSSGPTRVAFDLPLEASVELSLFDAAGRRVHTLERGALPAGRHAVAWDGRDGGGRKLPAGIYYLRLDAGGFRATRRIVRID